MADLQAKLSELGEELAVPGVSVGVVQDGSEEYGFHGVTSIENPLDVDANTLFQFGSTGKTYTATAIMLLVDQGVLALDDKVKKHLPELTLKDKDAEANVTVLQLLNHTAGWSGDVLTNTGDGDDALEKYVALLADVEQVTPLGTAVSYNNAALSVAGRVIEKVTNKTYEQAMKDLLFAPLGLDNTFFFPNDIMTRRFAVGHERKPDGTIEVARPWALPRGGSPAGGMSANAADQVAWAKFHLGDGRNAKGERILSTELLDLMKQPSFEGGGGAIGDNIGIGWWLRKIDGVTIISHGGTTNGQHSAFFFIPEHNFGAALMTNCGPNGPVLNDRLQKWLLEERFGLVAKEPEPIVLSDEALAAYAGEYATVAVAVHVSAKDGGLVVKTEIDPEVWKEISDSDEVPDSPPYPLGMLEGGDQYVVTDGDAKGMRGYFVRDASGKISGIHIGGRLATRVS
jgi:CubicO group peptidase (beta-lactamase class C family)